MCSLECGVDDAARVGGVAGGGAVVAQGGLFVVDGGEDDAVALDGCQEPLDLLRHVDGDGLGEDDAVAGPAAAAGAGVGSVAQGGSVVADVVAALDDGGAWLADSGQGALDGGEGSFVLMDETRFLDDGALFVDAPAVVPFVDGHGPGEVGEQGRRAGVGIPQAGDE